MKHSYFSNLLISFIFFFMFSFTSTTAFSQCPGGGVPTGVAYDTTVSTGSGNYLTEFKFPKIDPQTAMLTCVKLCLTITGQVSMFLENNVNSSAIYNIDYSRVDTLTGTGLNSPLTNQITVSYGPYNLAASDGVPLSGPDFVNIGPDTILQSVSICRTLTDSLDLSLFYGTDSVAYTYKINAGATVTGSGDYLFSVATTGTVNYKLEYCTCPVSSLPLNVHAFSAKKITANKAELKWSGVNDPNGHYHYEAEVSRNGHNFSTAGSLAKHDHTNNMSYSYVYTSPNNEEAGVYFFRIKQVYSNGYTRFSEIRSVNLESAVFPKFSINPNPTNGIVGIKFDNNQGGKMIIQVFNTHGQKVVQKEVVVSGSSYQQIVTLQSGVYWLRLTDVTSHLSCVNQLFIK